MLRRRGWNDDERVHAFANHIHRHVQRALNPLSAHNPPLPELWMFGASNVGEQVVAAAAQQSGVGRVRFPWVVANATFVFGAASHVPPAALLEWTLGDLDAQGYFSWGALSYGDPPTPHPAYYSCPTPGHLPLFIHSDNLSSVAREILGYEFGPDVTGPCESATIHEQVLDWLRHWSALRMVHERANEAERMLLTQLALRGL